MKIAPNTPLAIFGAAVFHTRWLRAEDDYLSPCMVVEEEKSPSFRLSSGHALSDSRSKVQRIELEPV